MSEHTDSRRDGHTITAHGSLDKETKNKFRYDLRGNLTGSMYLDKAQLGLTPPPTITVTVTVK